MDKFEPGFTGGRVDPPQPEGVAITVMKASDFFVVGSGFRRELILRERRNRPGHVLAQAGF